MNLFLYQLKQAYLSLKQKPIFVVSVVSTMGITLGALLSVLTLAYVMLVKPLPYPEQGKLYTVAHAIADKTGEVLDTEFTYPSLVHLYKNQQVFTETAIVQYGEDILSSSTEQPKLNTAYVTPEWFSLLGGSFVLGRSFTQTEALNTHNPVAILTAKVWREVFASDRDILNKSVTFRNISFRVIGVLKQSFIEPQINSMGSITDIWLPWDFNLDANMKNRWGNPVSNLFFVGKLKTEFSSTQAEQRITPLINDKWQASVSSMAFFNGWNISMQLHSLRDVIIGKNIKAVYLLLSAVFGLALIAGANITNLFMSRTVEQQKSLAINAAVGAKQMHLFGYLFAGACLLMTISIIIALTIAHLDFSIFQRYLFDVLPRVNELTINSITLTSALVLVLIFSGCFAFFSLKSLDFRSLNSRLMTSGKGTGIQISKRFRQGVIHSQVTIAIILVFSNLSLFNSAIDIISEPLGWDHENIHFLTLSKTQAASREEVAAEMKSLQGQLSGLIQVQSVSQSSSPLSEFGSHVLTPVGSRQEYVPQSKAVDQSYFTMIKQPLIEGDFFTLEDIDTDSQNIIINDVFAKMLMPQGSAVGTQLNVGGGEIMVTVIGVVKGIKLPGEITIPSRFYLTSKRIMPKFLIKVKDNQVLTRQQIVMLLKAQGNRWLAFGFDPLSTNYQQLLFTEITTALTTLALTLITCGLAAIGLFGILNHSIQTRRFEIGTRMAIGAKGRDIIMLIFKENASAIISGIAMSIIVLIALYLGFSDNLASYISLELVPIFIITLALISLLSLLACYLPLRQYINKPAIHTLKDCE